MQNCTIKDKFVASLVTCLCFLSGYNFTNWVSSKRSDIGIAAFSWESHIPFIPVFIIPYWSIDLFFIAAPFIINNKHELEIYKKRILLAIAIAGLFFLVFPLQLQFKRPQVEGFIGVLHSSLDNLNNFWNLAPSLHIALRTILWTVYIPRFTGVLKQLLSVWFILIGLSTLFCWQHHVLDVFTGQLLGMFVIQVITEGKSKTKSTMEHYKLACRYYAISVLFVFISALFWLAGFILLWPGVSFLLVSICYYNNNPTIFGKINGTLTPSAFWIFLPYRFIAKLWQRQYLPKNLLVYEIESKLLFGAMPNSEQSLKINTDGILDLTAEYSEEKSLINRNYINIPMLDLVLPSISDLNSTCKALEELLSGDSVYVHCVLGLGRSPLVVAAWLLHSKKSDNAQMAADKVLKICPKAKLGDKQIALLTKFQEQANG